MWHVMQNPVVHILSIRPCYRIGVIKITETLVDFFEIADVQIVREAKRKWPIRRQLVQPALAQLPVEFRREIAKRAFRFRPIVLVLLLNSDQGWTWIAESRG